MKIMRLISFKLYVLFKKKCEMIRCGETALDEVSRCVYCLFWKDSSAFTSHWTTNSTHPTTTHKHTCTNIFMIIIVIIMSKICKPKLFIVNFCLSVFLYYCREPVDPTVGKPEDPVSMMPPSSFLPMPHMMAQSSGIGQSPSSTTLDLNDPRDMYHPALMNPHLVSDGRRIKQETSHG